MARLDVIGKCHWLLGLAVLACLPSTALAGRQPPAAIVIDANTGKTLHAQAADARRYPASLTKMMTLYLVFERLQQRRLTLSTPIRFSERAASQQPSKLGLKPGEAITVSNAISALITKSANDVATAVAEHIGGSEHAFARLMTAKARQLGMSQTVFKNASGLPDKNQFTTARDMARLGLALQDHFPRRYKRFAQRRFAYQGRRYKNHNRLLGRFPGTDGIKTGYTRASGFNITTSVRRDGKHLIGVVIGQKSGRVRDTVMRRLLVKALTGASVERRRRRQLQQAPLRVARPRLVAEPRPFVRPRPVRPSRSKVKLPSRRPLQRVRRAQRPLVRQPSTFGAQVARMKARSAPAPTYENRRGQVDRVASPVKPPARRPLRRSAQTRPNTHQVQIGAFFSDAKARDALARAQQRAGPILRGFQPVSVRVSSSPRTIYRARFAGFDLSEAAATCSRLKTMRVDCFVTRNN